LNILLVSPFRYTDTGGVCTTVRMLHQEFGKAGNRVNVLTPGESDHVHPLGEALGVSLHGIYLRVPFIKEAPLKGVVAFCLFLPFTLYSLLSFIKREQITVIAIQYPLPQLFYFGLLRWLYSCRLIVTLQGSDVHDLPTVSRVDQLLVRCLLKRADSVIAVSKSLLDKLYAIFPDLTTQGVVIPNGATIELLCQNEDAGYDETLPHNYVLTVGQLIHRKGIDVLIGALKIVRDRGCVIDLVVVGEGEERLNLSQRAADLGLAKNVHFIGNQSHEKTSVFFKNCLFFVLASRAEGLPLVIVEAMASGKAVIATAIDGIPEIIEDESTGILVPVEDPASLANALMRLYQDSDLRARLALQGQKKVFQDYAWRTIARKYLEIFQENRTSLT
jgi:glycosyltransferase involved in cell wall biosynthesis